MSSFSIVTNVNSLVAQQNLLKTNSSQQSAIERLTTGLRINSSADDAAGLAIANRFRSDISVLQQGVRNAADGLSTLQTIDGGLNNISLLIDRARTLATQSASGTFAGDRGALNAEFQSVIQEINRQAQSIGLDPGGSFNAALSVFIGGGRSNGGVSEVQNGAVQIDLTNSAVNGQRLGLEGVRALGGVEGTTDIGSSSATSVQNIVTDTTNLASLRNSGFTEFVFNGPGFSDSGSIRVSVNLAGVVDSSTLAAAINSAIGGFSATSAAGQSFKEAGITAVINTDSTGKQQLSFTSSDTAFQVRGGDRLSNAVLGNFDTGATGASLDVTRTGASVTNTAAADYTLKVVLDGGGLYGAQTVEVAVTTGDDQEAVVNALQAAIAGNTTLASAGFNVSRDGNEVVFSNNQAQSFQVRVAGDADNILGFGTAILGAGDAAVYNTITGAGAIDTTTGDTINVSVLLQGAETAQTVSITVANGATDQAVVDALNLAFKGNAQLNAAGFTASEAGGVLSIASSGENFLISVEDAQGILALGDAAGGVSAGTAGEAAGFVEATINSGGAQATTSTSSDPVSFTNLIFANDVQSLVVTAKADDGSVRTISINLSNANANSVDAAVKAINDQLQQSNDATLQRIVAVKERDGVGTEGVRFLANLPQGFSVGVGDLANNNGLANDTAGGDSLLLVSGALEGGSIADISTRENAENAVTLLAAAVTKLGVIQADVGRSQNRLQFAIGLATTQITNLSAAESRIRDADMAAEAANLTRTSIAQQAGVAALAQANSAPQAILALLRG